MRDLAAWPLVYVMGMTGIKSAKGREFGSVKANDFIHDWKH